MNEIPNLDNNNIDMDKILSNIENNPEEIIKNIDNTIMKNEMQKEALESKISKYKQSILELNDPELTQLIQEIDSDAYNLEEVTLKIQNIKQNTINSIKDLMENNKDILEILTR